MLDPDNSDISEKTDGSTPEIRQSRWTFVAALGLIMVAEATAMWGLRLLHFESESVLAAVVDALLLGVLIAAPVYFLLIRPIRRNLLARNRADRMLRAVLRSTSGAYGERFCRQLVEELTKALNVPYAFLAEVDANDPNKVSMQAFWANGELAPNLCYDLTGTPCQLVMARGESFYPHRLQELFPNDSDLPKLNAQSYMGVALYSTKRRPLGLLAIIDEKPMVEDTVARSLLNTFAARAAVELERMQAETALRESEERLSRVTETTSTAILVYQNERMCYVNDACAKITGYSRAELLAMRFWEIIAPDIRESIHERGMARQRGEPVPVRSEVRIVCKDGSERWIDFTAGAITWDGRPAVIGTGNDITDRKRTETALRERDRQLRESQLVARLGSYVLDITNDIWSSSQVLDDIFGIDEQFPRTAEGWACLVHPDQRQVMIDYLTKEVFGQHNRFDREYQIIRQNTGEIRWVHGLGELEFDRQNRPVRMIGTISDITERKRAEEALRESEGRFRLLTDHSPLAVAMHRDGRFVYLNPAAVQLFGAESAADLIGQPIMDRVHPDFRDLVRERIQLAHETGSPASFIEEKFVRLDGSVIDVEAEGLSVTMDGQKTMLVFALDVSERKRQEKERIELERRLLHAQKLESLGVLSGGVAHDFNNLLAAIVGHLDLATAELPESSPAREPLDQVAHAATRAADLCRQMLAYSGKGQFEIAPLDINELVSENAEMLRTLVSRNVMLEVNLGRDLPAISADAGQIQQVVMNLITNASEAVGDKPGTVALSTGVQECDQAYLVQSRFEEKPAPGTFVWLQVADSGCGMDIETRQRLFEPFYTTKFTGRGLGMSAVHGIVRVHGGALIVESEVDRGSIFKVLFPVSTNAPGDHAVTTGHRPSSTPEHSPETMHGAILIVDDEKSIRDFCTVAVERMGCRPLTACDGLEALEALMRHRDDIKCVLLDLTMPRMNGVATFEAMIKIKPDLKVILCSGYSQQHVVQRFSGRRPSGFIHKPFRLAKLRAELERVVCSDPTFAEAGALLGTGTFRAPV